MKKSSEVRSGTLLSYDKRYSQTDRVVREIYLEKNTRPILAK